uniref:Uncharacterized protein n=1 Tax=Strigops habroptila TaxID=2489341 RepID=A0A672VDE1_STRHB
PCHRRTRTAACSTQPKSGRATSRQCHIPAVPHPGSATSQQCHIPAVPHPGNATSQQCHIPAVPHPGSATSQQCHIPAVPHPGSQCHIPALPCPVNATSRPCRPLQQSDPVLTAGAFTALRLDHCLYRVHGTSEHSVCVGGCSRCCLTEECRKKGAHPEAGRPHPSPAPDGLDAARGSACSHTATQPSGMNSAPCPRIRHIVYLSLSLQTLQHY